MNNGGDMNKDNKDKKEYKLGQTIWYEDGDDYHMGKIIGMMSKHNVKVVDEHYSGTRTKEYYVLDDNKRKHKITDDKIKGVVVGKFKNKEGIEWYKKGIEWYKKGDVVSFIDVKGKKHTGMIDKVETDAGGDYLIYCFDLKRKMWVYPKDIICKEKKVMTKNCGAVCKECPDNPKDCEKYPKKGEKMDKVNESTVREVINSFTWMDESERNKLLKMYIENLNKANKEKQREQRINDFRHYVVGDVVREADDYEMENPFSYGVIIETDGNVSTSRNYSVDVMYADGMVIEYDVNNAHEIEFVSHDYDFEKQIKDIRKSLEKKCTDDMKRSSK